MIVGLFSSDVVSSCLEAPGQGDEDKQALELLGSVFWAEHVLREEQEALRGLEIFLDVVDEIVFSCSVLGVGTLSLSFVCPGL